MRRLRSSSINIRGVAFLALLVCLFSVPAAAQPWDGNGVEGDPYLIYDACDMQAIGADSNYWDAHFELMADIDLSAYTGASFNIIGYLNGGEDNKAFTGTFDGNEHTISNLTINSPGLDEIGLFGFIGENSELRNLRLEDVNITGAFGVGGLVGIAYGGRIYGCSVSGIVTGQSFVGGLIGDGWNCEIMQCSSDLTVTSNEYGAGGMIGAFSGILRECYSLSEVNSPDYAGGLVGFAMASDISSCYAEGIVSGAGWSTGGLIGACVEVGPVIINNCYSSVQVTGHPDDAGGLIGSIGFGIPTYINACFWDVDVSGQTQSAGGIGKSTEQMKSIETYHGWGCGVWTIEDGVDYPRLAWQGLAGELLPEQTYGGGSGKPNNPYLIYTAEQLNAIGKTYCHLERSFRLMADIDMNQLGENEFEPIGQGIGFTGIFDGDGHTIQNLSYQATGFSDFKGLFAQVGNYYEQIPSLSGGEVKNLQLSSPKIVVPEGYGIGSLCGMLIGSTIENCSVTDCNVTGGDCTGGVVGYVMNSVLNRIQCKGSVTGVDYVGGLAGYSNYNNSVPNGRPSYVDSSFEGNVSGHQKVGGMIGYSEKSELTESFSNGNVSGTNYYVGGLVGYNKGGVLNRCYSASEVGGTQYTGGLLGWNSGTISGCYSTGGVTGSADTGGLVGYNTNCNIYSCYATGKVDGSGFQVGGLVGRNKSASVRESYATGDVNGLKSTGGLIGHSVHGSGQLERCFAKGYVRGTRYVGGLVGWGDSGDFRLCYATGNVFGTITNIGGLVGRSDSGAFNMCYATGNVGGPSYVGGLVGLNLTGAFVGCFWDVEKSGTIDGVAALDPDPNGVMPKTTVEMQTESTFTDTGWDFTTPIWDICDGTNYPKLTWQIPVPGDFVCPDGVDMRDFAVLAAQWREILSANVAPDGGDGIVNFLDWAVFADGWQSTTDIYDLAVFVDQWLSSYCADIAPDGGDGVVNMRDLRILAENWLEGIQ